MFVYIRSAAFVIVVTQKLVLQQSKNVTPKCTETLSPPPSIQYLLEFIIKGIVQYTKGIVHQSVFTTAAYFIPLKETSKG